MTTTLALFDLDHTLLSGDSDVLWCQYLIEEGVLDPAEFGPRNADMETRYRAGTVGVQEFCEFFIGTLTSKAPADWEALRQRFLRDWVAPRIPPSARALVDGHRADGALVVLTTATNRFITEYTATHLGIEHLIATEPELREGRFSGRVQGTPNMREGKVLRLNDWLADRGLALDALDSVAYSDSINDLPLLSAARRAVAVDPDTRLQAQAEQRGWQILRLPR